MRHSHGTTPKFRNGNNDRKRTSAAKAKTVGRRKARAAKTAMFAVR